MYPLHPPRSIRMDHVCTILLPPDFPNIFNSMPQKHLQLSSIPKSHNFRTKHAGVAINGGYAHSPIRRSKHKQEMKKQTHLAQTHAQRASTYLTARFHPRPNPGKTNPISIPFHSPQPNLKKQTQFPLPTAKSYFTKQTQFHPSIVHRDLIVDIKEFLSWRLFPLLAPPHFTLHASPFTVVLPRFTPFYLNPTPLNITHSGEELARTS